jgi:AcrR family transcriptional regulator
MNRRAAMPATRNTADVSQRSPGRPTRSAAADLHERILRVALDEFLSRGFGAASIEGIARAAGVNKDTIYRQFGTKERLYRTSVMRSLEALPRGMRDLIPRSDDVAQTLAEVMRRLHRMLTTPRAQAITSMTVTQAALFPDLAAAVRADTREYLQPLADYLRELQEDGTLALDDPQEAAEMLAIGAVGGVRFLFEPSLRGEELDAFVERRLKVFLRGWDYRPKARAVSRTRRSTGRS